MNCRSFRDIRQGAEELVASGVSNREQFGKSLALITEAGAKIPAMRETISSVSKVTSELSEAAARYAISHLPVFEGELVLDGKGVRHGDVELDDGQRYHFAWGVGRPERQDGAYLTQAFLATLPKEWTRQRLELDTGALYRLCVTSEQLEKYGLTRPNRFAWTLAPAADLDD